MFNRIALKRVDMWFIGVAGLLGGLLGLHWKIQRELRKVNLPTSTRVEVVQALYLNAKEQNEGLIKEIESLRFHIAELENEMARDESRVEAMRAAMDNLRVMAGLTPVSGPGITITVDDRDVAIPLGGDPNGYVVHDFDLLRLVNDLKAAGAEAISVNRQRIVSTSEIRCSGPVIKVNGVAIPSPFEILAIGDQDVLESATALPGGVVAELDSMGIRVTVTKSKEVQVPALAVTPTLRFAVPSPRGEGP